MSKLKHVIPAPASRLLDFAESQPNLICYGVSGLKPGSVRLLVPSLKAGVILSGRQPERQSYNSAIYGGDYIPNINAALAMTSKIAGGY